jgi:L-alanine-DL-glutamate epimerase-like enolase superfamily enzyme
MQITKVEVTPVELSLRQPVQMVNSPEIKQITAVFVHLETRDGLNAWGCAVAASPEPAAEAQELLAVCQECADRVPSLHPTNIEYALAELMPLTESVPAALCAFDLAFHDLLGLAAGMPLYRLLGGYRDRIQTSVTVPLGTLQESVEMAQMRARQGFRLLKIKGGLDPALDVQRIRAIRRLLPEHPLRLDADGGYTVEEALDVARALEGRLEMLEQPTQPDDDEALRQVTLLSPVPVLADQSITGPASALQLAAQHSMNGMSIKLAACGGLMCARQMEAIARAARLMIMVSCVIEPALLTSAGLSFALSSPTVRYADLDGYLDLILDPSEPTFTLKDGWLIASEVPGLGCHVNL